MAHLLQVGAGSGGMPVLDLVCREPAITRVTLIEPDVYKPHNVHRHLFPPSAVDGKKAELASRWLRERRPDLKVALIIGSLLDRTLAGRIDEAAAAADIGVCAADNEPAKHHFDALMRRHGKPWTLGEVLSGGIGGFVHWFTPGGPCYGCVASFLKRSVTTDEAKAPDYSQPGGPAPEVTVPASCASIHFIASLHAHLTLQLLARQHDFAPGFTTLLFTLEQVPGVFAEAYRPHRFSIPRSAECLCCGEQTAPPTQDVDKALQDALDRLR
jgi:molybdopterin/thiamine biosynthesis adenylyltransferase